MAVPGPSAGAGAGPCALGIDLGTSGPKVGVFAPDGTMLGHASRRVETVRSGGGAAEQDSEAVWTAVADAVREAVRAAKAGTDGRRGIEAAEIVAVGVDSQYSSIVPVASDGTPTGPMVTWMDTRGAPHNQAIYEREPDAFFAWLDLHGIIPLPSGADSLAHLLHIQHDHPDVHERTAAYLEPMDYVTARLTGRPTATQCSAFMLLLTDNRTLDATDWHPDLVRMAGVDPSRLPPLVARHEPVGRLRPEVAADLGLDPRTVVYPGVNDTQIGGLATGAIAPGATHAGLCIGTTSVLIAALDRKDLDADHQLVSMPSPTGGYMLMAENGIGGKALDHVLHGLLAVDDALGDHHQADAHERVPALVAASAPGAGGVLFLPWLGGAMAPVDDPFMRGGFVGVTLGSTRADLVRATLEGLAHNLRWLLGPAEAFCGHPFEHVVFGGGGARSATWGQILADVLDRPIHRLADPAHVNGRAAALLALAHHGEVDLDEAAGRLAIDAVHEPDPAWRARYDGLHEQFVAAYAANQPVAHALRAAARR